MIPTLEDYMLREREISVVKIVSDQKEISVSEIGQRLGSTEGWASQIVKSLEKRGFVITSRKGMRKTVRISESNFAQSLSDLLTVESSVAWEKLLSNKGIPVILEDMTGERGFTSELNRSTVWRTKRNLLMHGITLKESDGKSASDARLFRFVDEYADHVGKRFIEKNIPSDAVILWRKRSECIFKINHGQAEALEAESQNIHLTALSAFPNYGIPFLTTETFYYFSPTKSKLTQTDVVLHTLLIDPNNRTNTSYAVLFVFKRYRNISLKHLIEGSRKYGLESRIEELVRYIRSSGRNHSSILPRWNYLKELAGLYGIDMR